MLNVDIVVLCRVRLFKNPWTLAHQAPLSMEFSRQEYGVGCHLLLQGIFLTQGLNPGLWHCRQILYHLSHQGSPNQVGLLIKTSTVGKLVHEGPLASKLLLWEKTP